MHYSHNLFSEQPPTAPTGVVNVDDITGTSIKLSWRAPMSDGGAPLTGYAIEKQDAKRDLWDRVGTADPSSLTYTIQNLYTGTEYFFRVIAMNRAGDSLPTETLSPVVLTKSGPPSDAEGPLKTLKVTRDSVTIQWGKSLSDGDARITGYVVEKREVRKQNWTRVAKTDPDVTTYCVQNLKEGHDYSFRVFAENKHGRSEPLETVRAVVPKRTFGE